MLNCLPSGPVRGVRHSTHDGIPRRLFFGEGGGPGASLPRAALFFPSTEEESLSSDSVASSTEGEDIPSGGPPSRPPVRTEQERAPRRCPSFPFFSGTEEFGRLRPVGPPLGGFSDRSIAREANATNTTKPPFGITVTSSLFCTTDSAPASSGSGSGGGFSKRTSVPLGFRTGKGKGGLPPGISSPFFLPVDTPFLLPVEFSFPVARKAKAETRKKGVGGPRSFSVPSCSSTPPPAGRGPFPSFPPSFSPSSPPPKRKRQRGEKGPLLPQQEEGRVLFLSGLLPGVLPPEKAAKRSWGPVGTRIVRHTKPHEAFETKSPAQLSFFLFRTT